MLLYTVVLLTSPEGVLMKLKKIPAGKLVRVFGKDGSMFQAVVCNNIVTSCLDPTDVADIFGKSIFICPENCRLVLRSSNHTISAISEDATVSCDFDILPDYHWFRLLSDYERCGNDAFLYQKLPDTSRGNARRARRGLFVRIADEALIVTSEELNSNPKWTCPQPTHA